VPAVVTERDRRRDLRRMKAVAGGFLLAALTVYLAVRRVEAGWAGYVEAAAEAGMVGGLADWFAVTALFRRPLGLPIPHTAIIPSRKDALGRGLEQFVGDNFLAEPVIRDRVRRAEPAARAGAWLCQPQHAGRVAAELGTLVRGAVAVLRDEDVQAVLEQTLLRRVLDRSWGPPAGRLLARLVADRTHHRLVDLAVDSAHRWLLDHREAVVKVVTDQAPGWSPRFVDDRVANRVYGELLRFATEVQVDPRHKLRLALDDLLARFAADLQHDPATMARAEKWQQGLLAHPEVRSAVGATWGTAKRVLLEAVADPGSELRTRVVDGLVALGRRLTADAELRAKVDRWAQDAAVHVVTTYRDELTTVITDTVNRWDAAETARKIELQVGRDLQFIRINGTVVGALAGLVIHAVSEGLL
jgi:uncharacterized membrane-anchored protein YjiN (DUF445 family)